MNGIYEHFKGNYYQVYGTVTCDNTTNDINKKFVLYKPLYKNSELWIREYNMFFEKIEKDGNIFNRFKLTEPNDLFLDKTILIAKDSETLENVEIFRISQNEFKMNMA